MKALKEHELNFYEKYFRDPEKIHRRNVRILYSLPVIALAACLACSVVMLIRQKQALESEVYALQSELNDDALWETYDRAKEMSGTINILDGEIYGMEMFGHIRETYPVIGMDEIYRILECTPGGIHVTSVSFEPAEGSLRLDAEADNVTVIPQYIDELKKTGLLVNADYSGYSGNTDPENGAYYYRLTVNMRVNPPETDYDFYDGDKGGRVDG